MTVISLELNELNMDMVQAYIARGELPQFARLIDRHGLSETTSEEKYELLEPWIQWVTAHTGQKFNQHQIFRLGDIRDQSVEQIWEALEKEGVSVGAISPMNAENRCKNPAFFVPDPWVQGKVKGPWALRQLYAGMVQAVNDNAQSRLTLLSLMKLMIGIATYARIGSMKEYLRLMGNVIRRQSWAKAMILDRLLTDVFIKEFGKTEPAFSSLFLNAAAHIQHHYMFSSAVYDGPFKNPDWYVPPDADPLLDVYRLYDAVVGDVLTMAPSARLIIATGLHQVPYGHPSFYWRLRDHAAFLSKLQVPYVSVEPRMSRDFVVTCASVTEAFEAQRRLEQIRSLDAAPLFAVDNRGNDLFVTLIWADDVPADFKYLNGDVVHHNLKSDLAFVAIKNGEHDGVGYVIDTGLSGAAARVSLCTMPARIAEACGVQLAA